MTNVDPRVRAVGLKWHLTALVALPILMCAALTAVLVARQVSTASESTRVARGVTVASDLQSVQADLQGELIPTMALTISESPLLRSILHLGTLSASDVGVTPALRTQLQARTDAAVEQLAAAVGPNPLRAPAALQLTTIRHELETPTLLPQGFFAALDLSNDLATRSAAALRAPAAGTSADVTASVRDAALVNAAVRSGASNLAYLIAFKFPGLGAAMTTARAQALWQHSWQAFQSATNDVAAGASPRVVAQWQHAAAQPGVRDYLSTMARYDTHPTDRLDVAQVLQLVRGNAAEYTAASTLAAGTSQSAIGAAGVAEQRADRMALIVGGVVALGLLASVAIAVAIRRRIARPLDALAQQADAVSRGELVTVTPSGPVEIRTVGRGLAAAVDSLRRIESQAAAVARGELDSEIVREPLPGQLGLVMHTSVATIIDAIHERDVAQSDLAYQATHDSLTDLPNRNQALVSIGHALQRGRRGGAPTALLFVDLDLFKLVNDTHGHAAGDIVLRVCAERMADTVRDSDVVYRLGGDEFVVLLDDVTRDFPFVTLAERMIAAISLPIEVPGGVAQVGASIGISLCQDASVDAERLISEADAAAYSAKSAGRGRVGVFDHTLRASLTERASLERALSDALTRNELVLHYQPVVEMGSSRPIGYEALIRWQHPTRGLVAPGDFIPVAEKSTLINRIGRWVLNEAIAQLARWDQHEAHPSGLSVAVNISGRHLVANDLVADVRAALERHEVEACRLVIEVTETVLIDDPIALDNLHRLRALGVVVAIDDFGTGFTSIGQLPKLPVDVLKIDRSFTGPDDPGNRELVRLIVGAAHAFGLSVVAEGVEGAEQADSLKELQVDTGQGYFYARPEPAAIAYELAKMTRLPSELELRPGAASE